MDQEHAVAPKPGEAECVMLSPMANYVLLGCVLLGYVLLGYDVHKSMPLRHRTWKKKQRNMLSKGGFCALGSWGKRFSAQQDVGQDSDHNSDGGGS